MPFGYSQPASWLREDEDFDRDNRPGAPDWFSLSGDVGFKRPNNRHDTFKVESLLGYGGYMDLEKSGGPLGLSNWGLEKPIKKFQEKNGLEVDGWLKPGGPTITKMKELYGNAFGGSLAPTPAMVDANAEAIHAGEDGFLYDKGPPFALKPSRRLDGKAPLLEFERWNREWARGSGGNPTSLVPEYETYIRDVDDEHGHDPGLIFARDLAKQIERQHGPENAGKFAKAMIARLSDRPDLQRQFLGGPVPEAPPVGTFKPDGLERAQQWIDAARIAAGVLPKFAQAASAATGADTAGTSVPIASSTSALDQAPAMASAPMPEDAALPDGWPTRRPATDVRWPETSYDLLDYVQTYGYPGEDPTQSPALQQSQAREEAAARWTAAVPQPPATPSQEPGAPGTTTSAEGKWTPPAYWPNGQPPTPEDAGLHGPPYEKPAPDSRFIDAFAPANYEGDPREAGTDELHGTLHTLRERLESIQQRVDRHGDVTKGRIESRPREIEEMRQRYLDHIKERAASDALAGSMKGFILGEEFGATVGTVVGGAKGGAKGVLSGGSAYIRESRGQDKNDLQVILDSIRLGREHQSVRLRIDEIEQELRRRRELGRQ